MTGHAPITPAVLEWRDGLPYSPTFDDIYFSRAGGVEETHYVFLHHNGLPERWRGCRRFVIGETGFGSGLNFLVTVAAWLDTAPADATLYYLSCEKHPLTRHDLQRALACWPAYAAVAEALLTAYHELVPGYHRRELFGGRVVLQLMLGEAQVQLAQLQARVDAWYLDGFAPGRNPAMWSAPLFAELARLSHPGTCFATYTAAGAVRRGLQQAGFAVSKAAGFGAKRELLQGRFVGPSGLAASTTPWFAPPAAQSGPGRVAVIGAGLAGASVAWAMARRGWQVSLIEQHAAPAQAASGNPAGVVLPRLTADMDAEGQLYLSCFLAMTAQLAEWQPRSPAIGWRGDGVLQLADARERVRLAALGLPAGVLQCVDAEQASALAGVVLGQGGLFYPHAGWLSPPRLCEAMIATAAESITPCYHRLALSLHNDHGVWRVLEAGQGCLAEAEVVVLANGYQVTDFAQAEGLPLQRVRGQLSYLTQTAVSRSLRLPLCYDGYLLPARDGQHVVGATYDSQDLGEALRAVDQQQILTHLAGAVPSLLPEGPLPLAGRVAFRTTSLDHLPVVGPLPDQAWYRQHYSGLKHGKPARSFPDAQYHPGLYITSGHGSRGLVTCLPTAQWLAALITGEPWPMPSGLIERLHPARFLVRALRRGQAG